MKCKGDAQLMNSKRASPALVLMAFRSTTAHALLLDGLDRHLQRTRHTQRFDAGIDPAQRDEPSRITGISVENCQISPGSVVGDVTNRRIAPRAGACCR